MARSSVSRALRLLVAVALAGSGLVLAGPPAVALIGGCVRGDVPHGDLTGDGLADVAVGEPGRGRDAGAVHVVTPLRPGFRDLRLVQGAAVLPGGASVPGTSEPGDRFGAATVVADFDGDGCQDLAVGAPGENGGRGAVTVLFGAADAATPHRVVTENSFVGETARAGEGFGAVLVAADLDGDERADLAIGVPGEKVTTGGSDQGAFVVVPGASLAARPRPLRQRLVTAATAGVPGAAEDGDRFGQALAAGDFDGDRDADLAVGVPGEDAGRGAVVVLANPGTWVGAPATATVLTQDSTGVPGTAEPGDRFGAALAAGDVGFTGPFADDLAVGVPGENADVGAVVFLPGSAGGLTGRRSTVFSQDSAGVSGAAGAGHRFGAALEIAQLEEGFPQAVVIGAPGDVVAGRAGAGSVTFLESTFTGPTATGIRLLSGGRLTQDSGRVAGVAEPGDRFGAAVVVGGEGTTWNLIVGSPGENLGGVRDAGTATYFDGSDGLGPDAGVVVEADTPGITGARDTGGRLGASVSS